MILAVIILGLVAAVIVGVAVLTLVGIWEQGKDEEEEKNL